MNEQLNLRNGVRDDGQNSGGLQQYYPEKNQEANAKGELSTAFGYLTQSEGTWSHAEGGASKATANYAHAEGVLTEANGSASHAQNQSCVASGQASHAGGMYSEALGHASMAHGYAVRANDAYQTVIGMNNAPVYGEESADRGIFVVGNGEYDHENNKPGRQSNAFVVYRDGHAEIQRVLDYESTEKKQNLSVPTVDWVRNEIASILSQQIQVFFGTEIPEDATAEIVILYQ